MIRQVMTLAVLGCLLLLNSVAFPQVVMHSIHHDHHSSSTHNSPICFWVCTAGQMEESTTILPIQITQIIDIIDPQLFSFHPTAAFSYQYARGPPPSFLAISTATTL